MFKAQIIFWPYKAIGSTGILDPNAPYAFTYFTYLPIYSYFCFGRFMNFTNLTIVKAGEYLCIYKSRGYVFRGLPARFPPATRRQIHFFRRYLYQFWGVWLPPGGNQYPRGLFFTPPPKNDV
jgi:hypothetical protein